MTADRRSMEDFLQSAIAYGLMRRSTASTA